MLNVTAHIKKINSESKLKAVGSICIDGMIYVNDVKVIEGSRGLFVSLPNTSYQKDGKTQYSETVVVTNNELRSRINEVFMSAYRNAITKDQIQNPGVQELPTSPSIAPEFAEVENVELPFEM